MMCFFMCVQYTCDKYIASLKTYYISYLYITSFLFLSFVELLPFLLYNLYQEDILLLLTCLTLLIALQQLVLTTGILMFNHLFKPYPTNIAFICCRLMCNLLCLNCAELMPSALAFRVLCNDWSKLSLKEGEILIEKNGLFSFNN